MEQLNTNIPKNEFEEPNEYDEPSGLVMSAERHRELLAEMGLVPAERSKPVETDKPAETAENMPAESLRKAVGIEAMKKLVSISAPEDVPNGDARKRSELISDVSMDEEKYRPRIISPEEQGARMSKLREEAKLREESRANISRRLGGE